MNEQRAREILKDCIQDDDGLYCLRHYMSWYPVTNTITLNDTFDADELEAIAWWIRNKRSHA